MSFYNEYKKYKDFNFKRYFEGVSKKDILRILEKEKLNELDFLSLLSLEAENCLELMAVKARDLTLRHFGKVVFLYTPLYLANYCVNKCAYCGFNVDNKLTRKKLSIEDVEIEAKAISSTGLKHILILTGESRHHTSVKYIKECIKVLRKYFTSISIEIYPLESNEYEELIEAGVDGLTIYQEVYNEETYDRVHLSGPKKNHRYRLDAPERACSVGMRSVNIGCLLGLDDWRMESFFTGLHANYLQNKFLEAEVGVSLPRIRPHVGKFQPKEIINDINFVQIMIAYRLFIPRIGISISTRESKEFRDNLIGIGATKMSAGVSTEVGGHALDDKSEGQFNISDGRSVDEMKEMIYRKGYQPVFKDWQAI